ncbi:MAG: peroxidase-related enzyme [Maricaulis sp.]|uniref:carboxymuconolactone decarboxylase family protein n=1 Tax=Maricaulis sp. TaxID=1486257 RepID=UPI001B26694F|nr:peroxidase-related enzyme [Maricaulis sp.]MBO6729308.1 peroxidase-related enzyme [Maricaulis sp.]MBO6848335.1 peroxidase-related enzyme [Maricaulis sp.]MBO6878327.1 peroxidase-related enzyme [Maricaulis sp.]
MSWIKTVSREAADGRLKSIYDRVAGPDGQIDNILASHSLRPHTLEGHMALYKATLHHFGNTLDKAYLETIGTYVSGLNKCAYCVEHHFAGLRRLLNDDARASTIRAALDADDLAAAFDGRELVGLIYARQLTRDPPSVGAGDVQRLREAGFQDGEILEINQVTAYFAYANRTVLGLGVSHVGEELGLSPNDSASPDDWSHG